ncbi:inorganic phosphate transporter [Clostridium oryzae]|uniref:Low-affinity inorganic phosphate transporter 1 n=1 Tax=Clostridium oryzae TaxID=1450648 RepID=A0A1V4IBE0_9CLOT|nr:inorganic phosphate transporter [Clostridium oryzae]OPJ57322.1 Low-affinity inorganic phosphate transporter 1 [Clostridium oryzae]
MLSSILILVIVLALTFDFINGFHDSANAIATSIGTKVLTPLQALTMSAVLNFIGAMINTEVAKTVGSGIIADGVATPEIVAFALIAAIIWNLITWYFAIPSSSSHALIGALIGAALTMRSADLSIVNWVGFLKKIILPLIVSPILGFSLGFVFMLLLTWIFHKATHAKVNHLFKKLQIASAALMSYSHGSNDAQKSMGVITMALLAGGFLKSFDVPWEVKMVCAISMAMGTMLGGWKIIKTMGVNMIKLEPINGFAAETGAALTIETATFLGAPVSTTHIITSSIMGVGACKRLSAVRWSLAKSILVAWVLTIPCSALIATVIAIIARIL